MTNLVFLIFFLSCPGKELITHAHHSVYILRMCRIGFDLLPQTVDKILERGRIHFPLRPPDVFAQFLGRHGPPGAAHQIIQEPHFEVGEMNRFLLVEDQRAIRGYQLKVVHFE